MFTVYKVTNSINGKHYIGVHKTDNPDDGYFGSGRAIRAAIKKHGRANFKKMILASFETASPAYEMERTLTADFRLSHTYNMRQGGVGGFTPENAMKGRLSVRPGATKIGGRLVRDLRLGVHALSKNELIENGRRGGLANKGKARSPEHRAKISKTMTGRTYPETVRINMSKARTGKKLSEIQRRRISAAMQASWARKRSRKAEAASS